MGVDRLTLQPSGTLRWRDVGNDKGVERQNTVYGPPKFCYVCLLININHFNVLHSLPKEMHHHRVKVGLSDNIVQGRENNKQIPPEHYSI